MVRPRAREPGADVSTRVRALLAGALVLGIASSGTLAAWSDGEFASSGLAAGTFALVSRTDTGAFVAHPEGSAAALAWPLDPLFPGESQAAWVQLQSSGSVSGEVTLTAVSLAEDPAAGSPAAALRDALVVRVSASSADDPAPPECTTSTPGTEVTGLTSVPQVPAQPVESSGGTTASFCIVVTLPEDAPALAQDAQLTPTWVFTGST